MLTKSGRDMPRKQNDDCAVVFPAADAEPVAPGVPAPTSAGLLAIGKPHNYNDVVQNDYDTTVQSRSNSIHVSINVTVNR